MSAAIVEWNEFVMPFRVLRLIREAPVTLSCVTVCAALYLASTAPRQTETGRREALHRWGAVVNLSYVRMVNQRLADPELILNGPLALWQGQWWRIPICAFHHVDFWHLLMNSLSAIYLGRLLEPRWGSRRLLLFLPGAIVIPLIPEFLAGATVVGFSGVIAAMFGALCVLRYRDESLREAFPEEAVRLGGALLALGVLSAVLHLMPVANLAHMTGFFWGALAGCATTGFPWGFWKPRLAQYVVAASILPGVWLTIHPVWNGTYLWFAALQEKSGDDRLLTALRQALQRDPQLVGAWRCLAGEYFRRGELVAGWETVLQGLSHNPSDADLLRDARRAWRSVVITPGRAAAQKTMENIFGELAAAWESRFRDDPGGWLPESTASPSIAEADPTIQFPLDQSLDLRLPEIPDPDGAGGERRRMPVEGDAVEGQQI